MVSFQLFSCKKRDVLQITGLKRIALLGDQKVMQPSVIDLYETEVSGKPCSCKRQDKETSEELTRLQTKLQEVGNSV